MQSHEDWELDELIMAVSFAGIGGFVFGFRRLRERDKELKLRKEAEERALWLAHHDPLTQLPNRRFLGNFSATLQSENLVGGQVTVLAVDLDGFKKVNDLLGHDAGDLLLKVIASRLAEAFPDDTVFRLGGDEFLVVVQGTGTSSFNKTTMCDALIERLTKPVDLFGVRVEVGASIGVAKSGPDTRTLEELSLAADAALYQAKRVGRNNAVTFEPYMREDVALRASRQSTVRVALEDNKLIPHYQPIVDLETGRPVGVEALTRWPGNAGAPLSTPELISLAEELGLIVSFSEKSLAQAIANTLAWPGELGLSFNMAAALLSDRMLPSRVANILENTGFPPGRLTLEVSERALDTRWEAVRANLSALSAQGVKIALDGYGGGHSNLGELAKLPFDLFKLDPELLTKSGTANQAILETYVKVAIGLEKPVVVVGIEAEAQRRMAQSLGCHYGQGHYYSPAVAADKLPMVLDALTQQKQTV